MTNVPFIWGDYTDFEGVGIDLLCNQITDFKGILISGIGTEVNSNSKGILISGIANVTHGNSQGINIAGLMNYAGPANKYLIQIGGISNITTVAKKEDFVLQLGGLYNKIGDRYCPFINIYGLKNLFKKSSTKKKNLENTLE